MDSARRSISSVGSSARSTPSMSGRSPLTASTRSSVRSMIERLRSPRKSIFSSPSSSTPCISYWVTMGASSGFSPAPGLR